MPRVFLCFSLMLLHGAAAHAQQDLPAGISLLEDRQLATKLSDAQAYLADQRWEAALSLLQEVAEANPSALIHQQDELFVGAVQRAQELLAQLPAPAAALRQELMEEEAAQQLQLALHPPDLLRLEALAQAYQGLPSGKKAAAVLQELWLDRGYPQLARLHGGAELQADWAQALPPAKPADSLMPPVFANIDDPSLPRIRAGELQPAWRFSFRDDGPTADLGHRMAFGNGLGYLTNGREVVALELGSGLPRWHFQGPDGWQQLGTLEAQEISDGASPLTLLAPVLADGVLLVVIQEPIGIGRSDSYSHIPIRKKLPARRLYAFDAETGTILWRQSVPWLNEKNPKPEELAAAPPAVAGGRVYLPVYTASGTVDLDLLAFDLHSGRRLWKRFLVSGTMETNLFGNVLSELACPPPVADLHRVFVCTHFGAVCAVDAASGKALWTRTYPRTTVRTRQNGRIGNRDLFFHNNPPVYDGKHFVVAPTDSFFALCLDAATGERIQRWPAVANNLYGTISNLLGMDSQTVWFSGTRVVRLSWSQDVVAEPQVSPALYDYVSVRSLNLNAGAIMRGGILAMSNGGVVELDADTLAMRGEALSWESLEGRFLGPAQITHGLLLLMTSKGVLAYSSPAALLDTLLAHDLTHRQLQEVLPLLDSIRFEHAPGLGHRVARRAEELAANQDFASDADALQFLAARTWLLVGESKRGLKQLEALLTSANSKLQAQAAGLILIAQPEDNPRSPRLAKAIQYFEQHPQPRVLTPQNHLEPFAAARARAQALAALSKKNPELQRQRLVALLLLENPGDLIVGQTPLFAWAQQQLQKVLQNPELQQAQETAAAETLAKAQPSSNFLRAFANTQTAQDWLQHQLASPQDAASQTQLLSWVFRYGDSHRSWPLLPAKLGRQNPAPPLAKQLQPLVSVKLDGAIPLHAMAVDDQVYVFLQDDDTCQILQLSQQSSRIVHSLSFLNNRNSLPNLEQFRFATATGMALLYKDRWIHIDYQGQRQERRLRYPLFNSSRPLRIGDFAAILLRGPGRQILLQVLDLASGVPYLQQPLDATADRYLQMVADTRYLHVLQDKSSQVQRIDLLHVQPPLNYTLPFAPRWDELQSARCFSEGIAILTKRAEPEGAIYVQYPNRPTQSYPLDHQVFDVFPSPQGMGWWTRPARSLQADAGPLTLHWLSPQQRTPWVHRFQDPAVKLPQLLNRIRRSQQTRSSQFLSLQAVARDQIEVECLGLGEMTVNWRTILPDLNFSNLVEPLPLPQAAADGWALLLRTAGNRRAGSLLHCFLVDNEGQIRDHFETPSSARSLSSQRLLLLPDKVLLRNGDVITLLGSS